jgi:hypothetical protein
MSTVIELRTARRELAYREGNGLQVRLLWNSDEDSVSVEVYDERSEELFTIPVPRDCALDAFRHPFAYASYRYATGVFADSTDLRAA